MSYIISNKDGITVIRFRGDLDVFDCTNAVKAASGRFDTEFHLWSFAGDLSFLPGHTNVLASNFRQNCKSVHYLTVAAQSDISYGVMRQLCTYLEMSDPIKTMVFRLEAEAMEWLLSQKDTKTKSNH